MAKQGRRGIFEDDQGVFMISVAAELAGMHPQTLRIYESRGLIKPKRSPEADPALLTARRRAAAAHPGAHDRGRPEPRRRRARARARGADGRDAARSSSSMRSRPRSCSARCCSRSRRCTAPTSASSCAGSRPARCCAPRDAEAPGHAFRVRQRTDERRCNLTSSRSSPRRRSRPRSGSRTSARNPEITPEHLLAVLLEQEGGIVAPMLAQAGRRRRAVRAELNAALDKLPAGDAARRPRGAPVGRAGARLPGRGAARRARSRTSSSRPSTCCWRSPASQGEAARDPAARRRDAGRDARRAARGARPAPRDRPEPRGQVPGAGALRPRPHRARRAGQARPGDRPRRGDPARDPGAVAAHQEQPGADRRARRRQDRDRRGPRAAHRRRATCPSRCATGASWRSTSAR